MPEYDAGYTFSVMARRATHPPIRSVGFLLIPDFALISYASVVEPLRAANQLAGETLYSWWHAAPGDVPSVASSGITVAPNFPVGGEADDLDLVLVGAGVWLRVGEPVRPGFQGRVRRGAAPGGEARATAKDQPGA